MQFRPFATSAILIVLLSSSRVQALIIHVPADQPSIQLGINAAASGDTVQVSPGAYVEQLSFTGKNILLRSQGGQAVTEITSGGHVRTVLAIENGEDTTAKIEGFTFRNAQHEFGVIWITAGITIRDCRFENNLNPPGGSGFGETSYGAIALESGTVVVEHCTFVGNQSYGAACLGSPGGQLIFRDNWCEANEAFGDFAGALAMGTSSVVIQRNVFVGNKSPIGGAIRFAGCSGVVTNNTFVSDTATAGSAGGGAMYLYDAQPGLQIERNLIANCVGSGIFGGPAAFNKNVTFQNSPTDYNGVPDSGVFSFSADPLFVGDSFYVSSSSPCLASNNAFGELVGARGEAISVGVDSEQFTSTRPMGFALAQNFPNPFNGGTSLRYYLATPAWIELSVTDLLGRKVAEVDRGHKAAGWHGVLWNGRDMNGNEVPSGVFFGRLIHPQGLETCQMTLIR